MSSYADRLAASRSRPDTDLRPLLTSPVREQGPRPLCVPFSLSGAHEATRTRMAAPGAEMLAIEPLWQHCIHHAGAGHGGTTLAAGGAALQAKGQTAETCWPYNETLGPGTEPEPAAATAAAWYRSAIIDTPLAHDGIEALVDDALSAELPVVLVVELTYELEHPSTTGEITVPPLSAPVSDYHAILALGAATNSEGTQRRLLVRNTWGPGWGAGGYGWLPLDYLIAFAVQAAAIDPRSLSVGKPTAGGAP